MDLYANDKIREAAERLVRQEVYACASSMVYAIYQKDAIQACWLLDIDYDGELLPLLERYDYEEAAVQHIDEMDADDLRSYLDDQDIEYEMGQEADPDTNILEIEATPIEELRRLATEHIQTQADADRDFCSEFNLEPDRLEVYEHWIVSSWLAGKLAERGHPTGELLGFTIWGRCTTGQGIAMDGDILEIARGWVRED